MSNKVNLVKVEKKVKPKREDYIATMYRLEETFGESRLSYIASELGVTLATASRVLNRLARDGYVLKTRRGTLRLTSLGKSVARDIIRRHRVIEVFLIEVFGLDLASAHNMAHELEHVESFAKLADEYLNFPSFCPHGNPIPSRGETRGQRLSTVSSGRYVVTRVTELKKPLAYVKDLDIRPNRVIDVLNREENAVIVKMNGLIHELPLEICEFIFVEKVVS